MDIDDLSDAQEALDTGICPQCGCEIDGGDEECTNIIHSLC